MRSSRLRQRDLSSQHQIPEEAVRISVKRAPRPSLVRLILSGACLLIILAPLYAGGNVPLVVALSKTAIFCMSIALGLGCLGILRDSPSYRPSLLEAALFVASLGYLLVIALQLVPLPQALLRWIAPLSADLYGTAQLARAPISLEPRTTISQLAWLGALLLLATVLVALPVEWTTLRLSKLQLLRGKPRRSHSSSAEDGGRIEVSSDLLHRAIIISSLVCVVIAIAHWVVRAESLFGLVPSARGSLDAARTHWPFVNPDHLAVFLEMGTMFALLRAFRLNRLRLLRSAPPAPGSSVNRLVAILRHPERFAVQGAYLTAYFVLALGALLTLSRAGVILIALGSLLLWYLARRYRPHHTRSSAEVLTPFWRQGWEIARIPLLSVILLTIMLSFIGESGRDLAARRVEYGLLVGYDEIRLALARISLDIFAASPLLGIGLGCWHLIAPRYMGPGLAGWSIGYAHSDPLQLLSETGLVGASLILLVVATVVVSTCLAWRRSSSISCRLELFGSSLVLLLPLLHSFVDFPFHIPAIALAYTVVFALHLRLLRLTW